MKRQASHLIHEELRHRGEALVAYPPADLWRAVGGSEGVTELIADLYRRIEQDELLRTVFPHFGSSNAASFFIQWFGGARLLLERGAEVKRHSGKLLTLAVVMNRLDLVRLLIEHGVDVERTRYLGRLDDAERPVADLLVANGKSVPDWMLPRACRPDVSTNELHRVSVLLDYGASLNDRGRYGFTALHYAVLGGKLPLIKLLLDRGAVADTPDVNGATPLLHLTKTRSKADPIPVMELLVESGADVNARDENQSTLLMYFARQGKLEAVQWLLTHGADRYARNRTGKTAAELGRAHAGIVRMLARS